MNTIDMIAKINAKKQNLDDIEKAKKQAEDEEARNLLKQIIELEDRIIDILEVGNAMGEAGLIHVGEPSFGSCREDDRLKKYGYPHGIWADGVYHHVGFMGGHGHYGNGEFKEVGFRNGGACGPWDFYVDGCDSWEECYVEYEKPPRKRRTPTIESMKKFLKEFPLFESAFYAWVNDITKI